MAINVRVQGKIPEKEVLKVVGMLKKMIEYIIDIDITR